VAAPITGETWGDVIEPVREYLLRESEQPFSVLREKLQAARAKLMAATDGLSDAQAEFRPGTGEGEDAWGIAEVLRHVGGVEPLMAERIIALGEGRPTDNLTPTYAGYMEGVETRRLGELRGILATSLATLVRAIESVEGHERLDTLDAHRRFGDLNCHGWIAMHTLHMEDHARQIEKLRHLENFPAA